MASTNASEQLWANNITQYGANSNLPASFQSITLTGPSNQITLGSGFTTVITSIPTSNVNLQIPTLSEDGEFIMSVGEQSITGLKTFVGQQTFSAANNQIVIDPTSTGNGYIINAVSPSGDRTLSIRDPGRNGNVYIGGVPGASQNPQQATSNTTSVAATGTCGRIRMNTIVPANSTQVFNMINSNIFASSCVHVWTSTTSANAFLPLFVAINSVSDGTCAISVNNPDLANNSIQAPTIHYLIL